MTDGSASGWTVYGPARRSRRTPAIMRSAGSWHAPQQGENSPCDVPRAEHADHARVAGTRAAKGLW